MAYIPTPEQAEELLKRYNKEPFHIQHAETVSKVLGEFAKEFDPDSIPSSTAPRPTKCSMSSILTKS